VNSGDRPGRDSFGDVTDWTTTAIALASLGLLWRFKINEPYIVIAAGILGIILR
jgi:chromate transporter